MSWLSRASISGNDSTTDGKPPGHRPGRVDEDNLGFYGIDVVAGQNFTFVHATSTNTWRRENVVPEQFLNRM